MHQSENLNYCPFCFNNFESVSSLVTHVNDNHLENEIHPVQTEQTENENNSYGCPVCNEFPNLSKNKLVKHIESHFNCCEYSNQDLEKNRLYLEEITNSEKEPDLLKIYYDNGNFNEQNIKNMHKTLSKKKLADAEFYDKQTELKLFETLEIDDGSTCVKSIIKSIRAISETCYNVEQTFLCSNIDFYSTSSDDKKWGCGYRNIQMLLSSLLYNSSYHHLLSQIPSVSMLQKLIEEAWNKGFDSEGRDQLKCKLHNTSKWIGATEVVTLLSSLRFRCQLVDICKPDSHGLHRKMFDWILKYFNNATSFLTPLYLQHHGHSRTIIGLEVLKDGEIIILILDPSIGCNYLKEVTSVSNFSNSLKLLRKSIYDFKHDMYQIVSVSGVITSEEEYHNNKIITSLRLSG